MAESTADFPHAIGSFPRMGSMGDETHGIEIHHPTHGWLPITVVNGQESQFAVSTTETHVWYSLDDEIVSTWPVKRAVAFRRWIERTL